MTRGQTCGNRKFRRSAGSGRGQPNSSNVRDCCCDRVSRGVATPLRGQTFQAKPQHEARQGGYSLLPRVRTVREGVSEFTSEIIRGTGLKPRGRVHPGRVASTLKSSLRHFTTRIKLPTSSVSQQLPHYSMIIKLP